MKYNFNQFNQQLMEKYPKEPFVILSYGGMSKECRYKCKLCDKEYSIANAGKLLSKNRKHLCGHCWLSAHMEEALNLLKSKQNLNFKKIGYNSSLHKPTLIYQCLSCGEITEKPITEFLKYPTCIHCGYNAKRFTEAGIALQLPEHYTLVGNYKGKDSRTLFKHSCGLIFSAIPNDIKKGHTRCPKCRRLASKGESKIIAFLQNYKILFDKEKTFSWSGRFRYDFFLPDFNILIEFHGIQHYEPVEFFGGEDQLKKRQADDSTKRKLAEKHNIPLIEIKYDELSFLEKILAQRLSQLGVALISETESTETDMLPVKI